MTKKTPSYTNAAFNVIPVLLKQQRKVRGGTPQAGTEDVQALQKVAQVLVTPLLSLA